MSESESVAPVVVVFVAAELPSMIISAAPLELTLVAATWYQTPVEGFHDAFDTEVAGVPAKLCTNRKL